MNARDELAKVIVAAYGEDAEAECPCEQDLDVAGAILAAGYRKPRTITTAEELDALPNMTVVRSSKGSIVNLTAGRAYVFGTEGSAPASSLALPVTVLHEPEATP
jgi:hypothetical protein